MDQLIPPLSARDHVQGLPGAEVELVEYGDYQCPHCKAAFPVVKLIQNRFGDRLCFAFRHFPLFQMHPHAMGAAEAAECAGAQGRFWRMHDLLFENSPRLEAPNLIGFAAELGLDRQHFRNDFAKHRFRPRVRHDIESGIRSGVQGTPAFFINGVRHMGGYDFEGLLAGLASATVAG